MTSIERRNMIRLLPVVLALLVSGCGGHDERPVIRVSQSAPVAVESIVPVRTNGETGARELLLVPVTAVFRNGELAGVLVVGADHRLSRRWIRTGVVVHEDIVVLGGLDKGELVVEKYNPELGEGLTVIKSPNVTEEVQSK
ncbi:MAG: hypothetical protein WCL42_07020 [Chlorobiaceae bacterium]